MQKKSILGISIVVACLIVLTSLTNVVGFQTVQSSNQKVINNLVDQKDLLFQTIVDIANNKEIQRIILKSQISKGGFFNQEVKYSLFNSLVLTKNQLKQMYVIGLLLSKIISKSRMQSIVGKYQFSNQEMQKEITAVIEKDAILNREFALLSNSDCDCENENTIEWSFPILCILLYPLLIVSAILLLLLHYYPFYEIMEALAKELNCFWAQPG